MKLGKIVSAVMVATTLGATAVVATPQADLTAQAKVKKSLKTIPKKFRGTWYHYEKADGYDYQKISTKKIKDHFEKRNNTMTMHQFDMHKGIKKLTKHNWMFAYKKSANKYIMADWNTYVFWKIDKSWSEKDLGAYQMTTRKYKGKTVKVIKRTLPNSGGRWCIYSPSKALAKHLWNLDNK
ncbi:hypothetical protein ACFP3T_00390 [Lactiplantibacillus dongliensis]|uniref:Uncharacterized protein n=1 Tax=Lactiplantibacillus dongliensis TaxID=2559919 RepID=A0ABW1R3G3_9LACO|nr:hypothetical protein [Lactiplantibacillus dongliensis]